jgi:hypothetical protein
MYHTKEITGGEHQNLTEVPIPQENDKKISGGT